MPAHQTTGTLDQRTISVTPARQSPSRARNFGGTPTTSSAHAPAICSTSKRLKCRSSAAAWTGRLWTRAYGGNGLGALRAFDAHALDRVLKPFDSERMQRALTPAKKQIR